ncbi:hypothetical protein KCU96_g52, partial [Aureobasidium melanogenum]
MSRKYTLELIVPALPASQTSILVTNTSYIRCQPLVKRSTETSQMTIRDHGKALNVVTPLDKVDCCDAAFLVVDELTIVVSPSEVFDDVEEEFGFNEDFVGIRRRSDIETSRP